MSFGFAVGDFLAVGRLIIYLYRSFKGAPGEFDEISRELGSFYIVLQDLEDQAGKPTSLLNKRGVDRKQEIKSICDNLMGTLEELQALYEKYRNMGRNAWMRVRLGERDLTALRTKLSIHIGLVNQFVSSLTMASVGRMEPMMEEILRIIRSSARGYGGGSQSLLSASSGREDGWATLDQEFISEGIPIDFLQRNRDEIQTLLYEIIEEEGLIALDNTVGPEDSASQAGRPPKSAWRGIITKFNIKDKQDGTLGGASEAEVKAATIFLLNHGYDLKMPTSLSFKFSYVKKNITSFAGALCTAAAHGNDLAVRLLVQTGGNRVVHMRLKHNGATAIEHTAKSRLDDQATVSMLKLLLSFGAAGTTDLKAFRKEDGYLAPIQAVMNGKQSAVHLLLDEGVRLRRYGLETPLHAAAGQLDCPTVKLLKARGASVNATCTKYYPTYMTEAGYYDDKVGMAVSFDIGKIVQETPLEKCFKAKFPFNARCESEETIEILKSAGAVLYSPSRWRKFGNKIDVQDQSNESAWRSASSDERRAILRFYR